MICMIVTLVGLYCIVRSMITCMYNNYISYVCICLYVTITRHKIHIRDFWVVWIV